MSTNERHRVWCIASLAAGLFLGSVATGLLIAPERAAAQMHGAVALQPGIAAIELRDGSFALVQANGGIYFLVDRQGTAVPLRFNEGALREIGQDRLLRSP